MRLAGVLGHRWGLAPLAVVFAAIVWSRRPEVLLRAEMWGDDGWYWYPDAYSLGWRCLLIPVGGYLNSFQRLVALAVQPAPLAWVPTLFAAVALLVQVAPSLFLVSGRMAPVWPDWRGRALFALILLALPNEVELYVNLTNAQWHLALLAFLVLVSAPPVAPAAMAFDAAVLAVSGLSGPFSVLLLPVAAGQWWVSRDRANVWRGLLLGGAALVQLGFLLAGAHAVRAGAPLGAGPRALARILALQVVLGMQMGLYAMARVPRLELWRDNVLPIAVVAAAGALASVALVRGGRLFRRWALFAGLVLAAGLLSPHVSSIEPQWAAMTRPPIGNRYFTFAEIAWLAVLFTLAADRRRALRGIGAALLLIVVLWAVPFGWRELPMPHTDFVARARAWAAAPVGTQMMFPLVPIGAGSMSLTKRGPD